MFVSFQTPIIRKVLKTVIQSAVKTDRLIQDSCLLVKLFGSYKQPVDQLATIRPFLNERLIKVTLARCIPEENRRRRLPKPGTHCIVEE